MLSIGFQPVSGLNLELPVILAMSPIVPGAPPQLIRIWDNPCIYV